MIFMFYELLRKLYFDLGDSMWLNSTSTKDFDKCPSRHILRRKHSSYFQRTFWTFKVTSPIYQTIHLYLNQLYWSLFCRIGNRWLPTYFFCACSNLDSFFFQLVFRLSCDKASSTDRICVRFLLEILYDCQKEYL